MAAIVIPIQGKAAAWVVPTVLTGSEITGVGTPLLIDTVTKTEPKYAKSASASKSESISIGLANGVTLEAPKETRAYDIASGDLKASGGDGADTDKISIGLSKTEGWIVTNIVPLRNIPALICVPTMENQGGTEEGFYFLLGLLSSEVSLPNEGNKILEATYEFSGKSSTASGGGATALELNLASITMIGGATCDPPVLTSGDVTNLLKGEIVFKAAA